MRSEDPRPEGRRRLARLVVILAVIGLTVYLLRGFHGRSVDAELVHRLPEASELLPAEVEVQVWEADTLHADAYFAQPAAASDLRHTVHLPPGTYRVTLMLRRASEPELEFAQNVTIEAAGSYYVDYELRR